MKPNLLPVEEALTRLFSLVEPLNAENIPLWQAYGRRLAQPVVARRSQPPFDASAMDGYALADASPRPGKSYNVVGEAAAGHAYTAPLKAGEATRIFTGAPVPEGALHVAIQEDTARDGDTITLTERFESATHIRKMGTDFSTGDVFYPKQPLAAADLGLIASMNQPEISVLRRPRIAILPTGDELVPLGAEPGPAQIINANVYSIAALAHEAGAEVQILPIAGDTTAALEAAFESASDADVILTIGGASVGDHDLLAPTAVAVGFNLAFHKIALRPGKPLLVGKRNSQILLGLPGNPVSCFVCAVLFLQPLLKHLAGGPAIGRTFVTLPLAKALGPNGPRDHYMRARLEHGKAVPFERQDSSLQSVLASADGLILQPKGSLGLAAGDFVQFYPMRSLDI